MLTCFFDDRVAIANHSASGESLRGALGARRVRKIHESMRKGDYLFVQFGHNDMKDKSPDALATYKTNLAKLVDDTRKLGGIPVLVTSMERKSGISQPTLKRYPQTVRDVAAENEVALIDLNKMSLVLYRTLGDHHGKLFQDGTHHNAFGSYQLTKCVVEGIRQGVPGLAARIRPDVPRFDPANPDKFDKFFVHPSPSVKLTAPEGN